MRWLGLALLGILVAAAISVAASRLASQQIGLASQPIEAGDALAPRTAKKPAPKRPAHHRRAARQAPLTPSKPPPAQPLEPPQSPEPPVYSPPAPTAPEPAPSEAPSGGGHDGERSSGGGGGGGADD